MRIIYENFTGEIPKRIDTALPANAATKAEGTKLYTQSLQGYRKPALIKQLGTRNYTPLATFYAFQRENQVTGKPKPLTDYDFLSWDGDVDVVKGPIPSDDKNRVYWTGDGIPKMTYLGTGEGLLTTTILAETSYTAVSGGIFGFSQPTISYFAHPVSEYIQKIGYAYGNTINIQPPSDIDVTNLVIVINGVRFVVSDMTRWDGAVGTSQEGLLRYYEVNAEAAFAAGDTVTLQIQTEVLSPNVPFPISTETTSPSREFPMGLPQPLTTPTISVVPFSFSGVSGTDTWELGLVDEKCELSYTGSGVDVPPVGSILNLTIDTGYTAPFDSLDGLKVLESENNKLILDAEYPAATSAVEIVSWTATIDGLADLDKEDVRYAYVLVTDVGEVSIPSLFSENKTWYLGAYVSISDLSSSADIELLPANITHLRIYRTTTSGIQFVTELDEAETSYTDKDLIVLEGLQSNDWAAPPTGMHSLIPTAGGYLAGAFRNSVFFSVPELPHAFPPLYQVPVEYDIVGLGTFGNTVLVLTNEDAYLLQGDTPTSLTQASLKIKQGCVSKRGIVQAGNSGVMYPSQFGLVFITASSANIITDDYLEQNQWEDLRPEEFVSVLYDKQYLGLRKDGTGILFDPTPETGSGLSTLAAETFVPAGDTLVGLYYDSFRGTLLTFGKDENNLVSLYTFDQARTYSQSNIGTIKAVNDNSLDIFLIVGSALQAGDYVRHSSLNETTSNEEFSQIKTLTSVGSVINNLQEYSLTLDNYKDGVADDVLLLRGEDVTDTHGMTDYTWHSRKEDISELSGGRANVAHMTAGRIYLESGQVDFTLEVDGVDAFTRTITNDKRFRFPPQKGRFFRQKLTGSGKVRRTCIAETLGEII